MYELMVQGEVVGIFSSSAKAHKFFKQKYDENSCSLSIHALGTFMFTDKNIKQEVIISVSGGVAEVSECPENVNVKIIDYDNLE